MLLETSQERMAIWWMQLCEIKKDGKLLCVEIRDVLRDMKISRLFSTAMEQVY